MDFHLDLQLLWLSLPKCSPADQHHHQGAPAAVPKSLHHLLKSHPVPLGDARQPTPSFQPPRSCGTIHWGRARSLHISVCLFFFLFSLQRTPAAAQPQLPGLSTSLVSQGPWRNLSEEAEQGREIHLSNPATCTGFIPP